MEISLQGPVLLAGAGCDLARMLAQALLQEGCSVIGACQTGEGLAACRTDGIEAMPMGEPETLAERFCDRAGAAPQAYVDFAHSRFERLLAQASPEEIDTWAMQDIGLRARRLRAITRAMLAGRKGRCLFVSSVAAEAPAPGQGYYAAAKLAGEALFAQTGLELACKGITACSLRLSWLESGRGSIFLQGRAEKAAKRMPTRHLISVAEACKTMLFLLCEDAASINARTISMDGGLFATKAPL